MSSLFKEKEDGQQIGEWETASANPAVSALSYTFTFCGDGTTAAPSLPGSCNTRKDERIPVFEDGDNISLIPSLYVHYTDVVININGNIIKWMNTCCFLRLSSSNKVNVNCLYVYAHKLITRHPGNGKELLVVTLSLGAGPQAGSVAQHEPKTVDDRASPWNLATYPYDKYHPMGEIYQWINQISEKYKDVVTQHFLGMTYETRPMYYLKISQPSNNPKKIIWMDCGIHAREWIAPAFCQWFVKEILQNYKDNSKIRNFLTHLDFYVLPVLNIDGYIYTWTTNRQWRKSRSPHNNGTCFGTDLNRNFDVHWCSIGASKNCSDLMYCGTGPVSEPETKAVSSLIESKKENILCFLTIHSHGQLILTPYGYTTDKSSNHEELIQVGQKAANALKAKYGTNYKVGSSADILYSTSGSSRDWARDIGIPFSYTFELRDTGTHGFLLPEDQIQATCEETMEAVLSIVGDVYDKHWRSNSAAKVTSTAVVLSLLTSFTALL
ncbi:PREDICTED: carboxypeptidase O [Condylura cristata]|uniref:carboxypeptidase O n=1 Tax=Condylura cristata TaxID=143302 RepID=UPI000334639C|nr:PREDICTED: carboxypeptidase O [Condylura cristata]